MRKKAILGILVAVFLLIATTLTACNSGTGDEVDLSAEVGGTITVSAYDTMMYRGFLEYAAQKFQDKYPGTTVIVETASSMPEIRTQSMDDNAFISVMQNTDNQQARDDYVSKINTELMSGRGADVIALDILPYYKYADNGQLADLSGYMSKDSDFNLADYVGNVFNGAKYKGSNYLFPIDYTFSYFAYDSSLAPDFPTKNKLTYSEVINAVAEDSQDTGNKVFGFSTFVGQGRLADMFSVMFAQDYEQFIDVANKKANLNNGDFAELLQKVQSYADDGYINSYNALDHSGERTFDTIAIQRMMQEKYYVKRNDSFGLVSQFTRDLGTMMGFRMSGYGGGGDTSNDEIAGLVANEKGDVQFSYVMGFGINSNSENKRTAWEFIKFLASEEIQSSGLTPPNALPVNVEARNTLAAMNITGESLRIRRAEIANPDSGQGTPSRPEARSTIQPAPTPPERPEPNRETQPAPPPPPEEPETGFEIEPDPDPPGEPEVWREIEREPRISPELTPEQQAALDNYLKTLEQFTGQLNKLVIRDQKIDDMINQEVAYFFSGEKTAGEVADNLQSKVNLYLNE